MGNSVQKPKSTSVASVKPVTTPKASTTVHKAMTSGSTGFSGASSFGAAAVVHTAPKLLGSVDLRSGLGGASTIRASALLSRGGHLDIRGNTNTLGIRSGSGANSTSTIRRIHFNDTVPGDPSLVPALGPAIGGPPDYRIDLNQVSPDMIARLTPDQTRLMMDLIDRANPGRMGWDDHGDTSGMLPADPVTYLPASQMFGMLMAEKMDGTASAPALANLLAARPELGSDGTLTSLVQQPGVAEQVYQHLMNLSPMTDARLTTVTNVMDHIPGGWTRERVEGVYDQLMSLGPVDETRLQRIGGFLTHVGGWTSERVGDLARAAIESGGTLTQPEADYLGTVISQRLGAVSSDPQRMQAEMNALLGAMTDGLPPTPENVGIVTGLVMAGALKEVASLRDDAQAKQAFLTNLTYSLAGLGNLAQPPWNAVVAMAAPWVASALSGSVSMPSATGINQWVGAIEGDWLQHPGNYGWSREDALTAVALIGVMLNENGFGYSRNP